MNVIIDVDEQMIVDVVGVLIKNGYTAEIKYHPKSEYPYEWYSLELEKNKRGENVQGE